MIPFYRAMVMARRLQRQETVLTSFLWLRHRLLDQQPNKTVLNRFIKNSYKTVKEPSFDGSQRVEKLCHSEPVRTLAWESPGFSNIFTQ